MNESFLLNTAKVRWLKSSEVLLILQEPPINLVVTSIPFKPSSGELFILSSKTLKRKWKQDGWTYMPRKQGIGFREDTENLKVAGEAAITCYYSYVINGLLEGEEKSIIMNRRIYKLFKNQTESEYYLIHYLKENTSTLSSEASEPLTEDRYSPKICGSEYSSLIASPVVTSISSSLENHEKELQTCSSQFSRQFEREKQRDSEEVLRRFDFLHSQLSSSGFGTDSIVQESIHGIHLEINFQEGLKQLESQLGLPNTNEYQQNCEHQPEVHIKYPDDQFQQFIDLPSNNQNQIPQITSPINGLTHFDQTNTYTNEAYLIPNNQFIQSDLFLNGYTLTNENYFSQTNHNMQSEIPSLIVEESSQNYAAAAPSYTKLQERIIELEERLLKLEFTEKLNSSNQVSEQSLFGLKQSNQLQMSPFEREVTSVPLTQGVPEKKKIKVIDYSPEWDYTKGGSKMMLCFQPALNELSDYQKAHFEIVFGHERVPACCIQPGVLKCFIPPHEKGLVKIQVYLEDVRIDDVSDKPSYFEFRSLEKKKKRKPPKQSIFNAEDEIYRSEFKVRIIDKLNSISDFIISQKESNNSNNSNQQSSENHHSELNNTNDPSKQMNQFLEFKEILIMLREQIECFDGDCLTALLKKILNIAATQIKKQALKKWIDDIDDNGYGLIHYFIILGFESSFQLINEFDCNLNLQSINGITPIELALALNHDRVVEALIKRGAIGDKIPNYSTSKQNSEELDLHAIFKNRNILDMLVREVTLQDSIHNSSMNEHSWNDQDEQEDSNYFELQDLCDTSDVAHINSSKVNILRTVQKSLKQQNQKQKEDNFEPDRDNEDLSSEESEDESEEEEFESQSQPSNNLKKPMKKNDIKPSFSTENLDKQSKKHKYLRQHPEIQQKTEFDRLSRNFAQHLENIESEADSYLKEKDEGLYQSSSELGRIKTIQKNVRGWLLRRQYLDIKYATRVLQNYIRQKIAKKHIKPECKNMIKNKLIDWLNIKH